MALERIVVLAGGVGGAKLVLGLARLLPAEQLSVIVNTADDFWLYGLAISPDLDTVMYALGGVFNPKTGWGLAGDSTQMLAMLREYGEQPWFTLGDRDVATHLLRTQWLAEGVSLTEVTRRLSRGLGVAHPLLPMTDMPVRTIVETVEQGTLGFQEYFVKHRWQPTVKALQYQGAEDARPTPAVIEALQGADAVIIAPSNPLLSVEPILAVTGMRELVAARPVIAVSPIIGGMALKGPAAKLMAELGMAVSPLGVLEYYGDLLAGFVFDEQDKTIFTEQSVNCHLLAAATIMHDEQDKISLARHILAWLEGWTA